MHAESLVKIVAEHAGDNLPYAGDISPQEAWNLLSANPNAVLVDVRSQPEWTFVGLPDLSSIGKKTLQIAWKLYPTFEINQQFAARLASEGLQPDTPILFICKTGGRSLDAACMMSQLGYRHCYNVANGFEGDTNQQQQRGTINGWKAANLPWRQA